MALNFNELGIKGYLVDALKNKGINEPTEIQVRSIPEVLSGKDVIGKAQTGTGKTLSFVLPMLQNINKQKKEVQGLIIAPTRELAIQITKEIQSLKDEEVGVLSVYGGQDVFDQIRKLKNGAQIVVGTPGRILDHLRRETINLGKVTFLVLDEADLMLNMGFLQDVESIIRNTPKRRQTLLFSATMPVGIKKMASSYMNSPKEIAVEGKSVTLDDIEQIIVETTDRKKQEALRNVMDEENPFLAIIFCRTKRRVSKLNEELSTLGYNCDELHGDLSQAKRERVMKTFRDAKIQYLVATDVAARGLDIEGVTHIFNYDIPEDAESYIHRIGRTGRAGQKGKAYTFVADKDAEKLASIEKKIKSTIQKDRGNRPDRDNGFKTSKKQKKHVDKYKDEYPKSSSRGSSRGPRKSSAKDSSRGRRKK